MTLQHAHSIGIILAAVAAFAAAGCTAAPAEPVPGAAGTTAATSGAGGTAGTSAVGGGGGGSGGAVSGAGGSITAGTGGTGETAGTGGSIGTAGTAGSSGSAGTGGGGGRPSGPSAGCNLPPVLEEPGEPIRHDLTVAVADIYKPVYEPRYYFTQIPQNFDPAKPYPVLFYGQGCGQTNPENGPFTGSYGSDLFIVQMIPAAVTAETVVPPGGSPGCFQAGRKGTADSPDGPYFDQVLAEIAAAYCIDMGQLYVSGWSSGAWLSNYLACARGNVIRGTSSGSGGLQHDSGVCTGGAISMLMPGDAGSTDEDGFDIGAAVARDLLITANGCSTTPVDMQFGTETCQYYGDCAAPIAYCAGPGGHGGPLTPIALSSWEFWHSVP